MQHIQLTEEQRQKANVKAVRARLYYSKPKPLLISQEVKSEIVDFAKIPSWKKERTTFNEHVKAWDRELIEQAANPPLAYLKRRCRELGLNYKIIIGACRMDETVTPRHMLMWEIRHRYGLSYPAIGRLFGSRDHSTTQFAVKKMDKRFGGPFTG